MQEETSLQVDEVVAAIRKDGGCAIVHQPTQQQVDVFTDIYDKKNPWGVSKWFTEIPDKHILHRALALGFQLRSMEDRFRDGPRRGEVVFTYLLYRNCFGDTATAIKALALMRLLPDVGAEDWLWITSATYDEREYPPPSPPENWPPRRASDT